MKHEHCPADPERIVEAYRAGRLPPGDAIAFEDHFIGCPRCGGRFQFTDQFVLAVRSATERLGEQFQASGAARLLQTAVDGSAPEHGI